MLKQQLSNVSEIIVCYCYTFGEIWSNFSIWEQVVNVLTYKSNNK